MIPILEKITTFLKQKPKQYQTDVLDTYPSVQFFDDTNTLEYTRLVNDLNDVYARLINGEYLLRDFSSKHRFNISGRQREFFTYLQSYYGIGKSWKTLLHYCTNTTRVADLCPGWSPKVLLGLYYHNFQGDVDSIDLSPQAYIAQNEFMRMFNHSFTIHSIRKTLGKDRFSQYGYVAGNHILDDLLLYEYSVLINSPELPSQVYSDETSIKKVRQAIEEKQHILLPLCIQKYGNSFDNMIDKKGYITLTHYKSYIDDILGNTQCYTIGIALLKGLKKYFLQQGYTDHSHTVPQEKNKEFIFKTSEFILLQKQSIN